MDSFEEIKELVLLYVRAIWKHRWLAIVVAWVVLVVGLVVVDQLQDRYTAKARVYIDTTSVLRPLLKGITVESDFESNIQLMVSKLLSRPNIERTIRLMDMDINVKNDLEMEKLMEHVKDNISISTKKNSKGKSSNIYDLSYEDVDPLRAKRMVQTLLDIFVEDTLGKTAQESDSAIAFLDKQIALYEDQLQEAERNLEVFKRKNVGIMPEDGASYFKQLQQVSNQLEQTNLTLSEAVQRRDKLKSQIEQIANSQPDSQMQSRYAERIAKLEGELEDLLMSYTDVHPDVINKRRILESLYKKRDEEKAKISETNTPVVDISNPVYQDLQVLLTETEANISSLSVRVANFKNKQEKLKKLVDVIPVVESQFKKLNRNYDVIKQNYTELVDRRERAKISGAVDSGTEQVKFRIIEPPNVPNKATFPNRPLFDGAALLFAIAVGYGISLLLSLMRPVFYNAKELKQYTELPVLGGVIKFDTEAVLNMRKWNVFLFFLANLSLVVLAVIVAALHLNGISVVSTLQTYLMALL